MKQISKATHARIRELLESGLSSRQIATKVGVNNHTIDRICAKLQPTIPKCKPGRPSKLTPNSK
jgi:hypothetical protein